MKVAIIGAGVSGLTALKYGLDYGHECDVFEQTGELGGIWVYREETVDKKGNPIMSPMYRDLMTNLPKELMAFCGVPYEENCNSYNHHSVVLKYLQKAANQLKLNKHIHYSTNVTKVKPIRNERWQVSTQHVETRQEQHNEYDAVFVCVGRQATSKIPEFPGQDIFQGTQFHSCFFRKPEDYENRRVLLVGGGPSSADISDMIQKVTPYVYICYETYASAPLPKHVLIKPFISHFTKNGVVFTDGSQEDIDVVIYGIGYQYYYPFLAEECGIQVENHCVRPLYNHVINVEHNTMFFVYVTYDSPDFLLVDMVTRYAYAALHQDFTLPPKEKMMEEVDDYICKKRKVTRYVHHLRLGHEGIEEYIKKLVATSGIHPMPSVFNKIYNFFRTGTTRWPLFKIVDNDNFIYIGSTNAN